jgi:hypothetical protein
MCVLFTVLLLFLYESFQIFSRNVGVTSKFLAPQGCRAAHSKQGPGIPNSHLNAIANWCCLRDARELTLNLYASQRKKSCTWMWSQQHADKQDSSYHNLVAYFHKPFIPGTSLEPTVIPTAQF